MRLGASFTFLRRSFLGDIVGREVAVEVPRLLAALSAKRGRTRRDVLSDRLELHTAVARLVHGEVACARW